MTLDIIAARLDNAAAVLAAASRAGVDLALACALVEKESGGRNVYGHDIGGTYSTRDAEVVLDGVTYPRGSDVPVTEANYARFVALVAAGAKSNGVGPAQITYRGYFPDAERRGLRLWVPEDNLTFGLQILVRHLAAGRSVPEAGTLYNAGNLLAGVTDYGRDLAAKTDRWRALLATPTTPTTGGTMSYDVFAHSRQPSNAYAGGSNEADQMASLTGQLADLARSWYGRSIVTPPRVDYNSDGAESFYDNYLWINDHARDAASSCIFHSNAMGDSMILAADNAASRALRDRMIAALNRAAIMPFGDVWTAYERQVSELTKPVVPIRLVVEVGQHDRADYADWLRRGIADGSLARKLIVPIAEARGWTRVADPLVVTTPTPTPAPVSDFRLLAVDGVRGPLTVKALQRWVGATQDGILGPDTTRALQRKLGGLVVDGKLGPLTVKALQRRIGASVDGVWGEQTTRRLQAFLNRELGSTL